MDVIQQTAGKLWHVLCSGTSLQSGTTECRAGSYLLCHASGRKWYMACRITPFRMTLSDLQCYVGVASLFKCDFTNSLQPLTRFRLTKCSPSMTVTSELLVCLLPWHFDRHKCCLFSSVIASFFYTERSHLFATHWSWCRTLCSLSATAETCSLLQYTTSL